MRAPCSSGLYRAELFTRKSAARRTIQDDAICIEGLHQVTMQVTCLVASGKIREPPTIAIQLACPDQISIESMAIDF